MIFPIIELSTQLNIDYIYSYETPYDNESVSPIESLYTCLCAPFTDLSRIDADSIEKIVSITLDKKLIKVQGKCSLKLTDGTELSGSWQNGRRNGQGSCSGPFLARFGVEMLAGTYCDGALSGIGKMHMLDGSIREGWFLAGKADGPFKGVMKVVYS